MPGNRWSALHQAAHNGCLPACVELLKARALPRLFNANRQRPLDVACNLDRQDSSAVREILKPISDEGYSVQAAMHEVLGDDGACTDTEEVLGMHISNGSTQFIIVVIGRRFNVYAFICLRMHLGAHMDMGMCVSLRRGRLTPLFCTTAESFHAHRFMHIGSKDPLQVDLM